MFPVLFFFFPRVWKPVVKMEGSGFLTDDKSGCDWMKYLPRLESLDLTAAVMGSQY